MPLHSKDNIHDGALDDIYASSDLGTGHAEVQDAGAGA